MSLDRRLQVLVDPLRYQTLEDEAARRGVSVASLVREALDLVFPVTTDERARAIDRFLNGPTIEVGDPDELKAELNAMYDDAL